MKYILTILLLPSFFPIPIFSQTWQWVNTGGGGGIGVDRGKSVVVSPDGTIFCMGETQNSTTHFGSVSLSSVGSWNTFVCTYSPNGSLINATATSGNTGIGGSLLSSGIKNTEQENYFTNTFVSGGAFFDTVYVNVMQSVLAKYDNYARCLWVKPHDYRIQYSGMGMYAGSIYVQGGFLGGYASALIDGFSLDTVNGKSFIVRLDTNGNCLWVRQAKAEGLLPDIMTVNNGRIYSRGQGREALDYDTLHVSVPDTFFTYAMQLDTGGRVISYNIFRGAAATRSISSDTKHNYYIYGNIYHQSIIGNDTLNLYNNASQDGFLAKFDSNGVFQWVKQFYSNNLIFATASTTDDAGNTYITGSFSGRAILGKDTITLAPNMYALFVARYNTNGDCLGVKIVEEASGGAIAQDENGNAIVTGQIGGNSNFDNLPFTLYGGGDFFVAKLGAITGITTSIDDERLVIYPNPNQKLFTIEVPQSIIQANSAMLDIYDNIGNVVQRGTVDISNGKVQVDIGNVQKGIYNVTLSTSKKKFTGRVVVE